jgi:hypothetical protein
MMVTFPAADGLIGTLKNSAKALLKRLRQDAYTDLVASPCRPGLRRQTSPPCKKRSTAAG